MTNADYFLEMEGRGSKEDKYQHRPHSKGLPGRTVQLVQKYTLSGKIKTRRNLFTGHWQVVRRDPGMLLTYYTRTLCSQHSPMYSGLQDTLPNAVLTGLKVAYSVWRMVDCVMIDIGRQGHPSPRARQS